MRINRLFEIIYLLLEKQMMTAKDLAQRFEVSTKTIYRDIDILSGAGIPVYTSKGKGGGICILPHFILNKSYLSELEQKEILLALNSLKSTNIMENTETLSRLSALFQQKENDWLEVDFSKWDGNSMQQEKFQLLKTAILEKKVLTFLYYSSLGEKTQRKVEPLKLIFKNSNWYLQAFCLQKETLRTFKICRMEQLKQLEQSCSKRNLTLPKLHIGFSTDNFICLQLLFSKEVAFRIYDEFQFDEIYKKENGDFLVSMKCPLDQWIYGYLLSFGEYVKVLSPEYVQINLQEKAKKILSVYKNAE